ncbi:histidine phosphatase family protein [Erysipelothrix tonsillarum]|uniref:histidine phosphatase family protein n=1 Tax=Erysipelothrix tonsillarum TaxID=38402 RepID=UPI00037B5CBD|nr:histidine phosphatase family protein [Erysipelothrix tonsillarum]
MTTTYYLMRHGKTVWNQEHRMQGSKNSPLTSEGIAQAEALCDRLNTIHFDEVIVSTSPRAQETAAIVFPQHQPQLEAGLREIEMGVWEGELHENVARKYPQAWHHFHHDPLKFIPVGSGEQFKDVHNRIVPVLDSLAETYSGKTIAIVSHGITLKIITNYLLGYSFDHIHLQDAFDSTSLTKIEITNGQATLCFRNDISHYQRK